MMTRLAPKRSAMPPANGWPTPHSKFWMAKAIENTSRSQWLACDSGARKKPSEERGPKLIKEIRQPHTTTTSGVRQPTALIALAVAPCTDIDVISGLRSRPARASRATYRAAGHQPNEYS